MHSSFFLLDEFVFEHKPFQGAALHGSLRQKGQGNQSGFSGFGGGIDTEKVGIVSVDGDYLVNHFLHFSLTCLRKGSNSVPGVEIYIAFLPVRTILAFGNVVAAVPEGIEPGGTVGEVVTRHTAWVGNTALGQGKGQTLKFAI